MTSPQEDDELMQQIVRAAPYSDIPNEANCQELFRLIKARDGQREREAFEKGRQVGQFQASDKLYSHVTTMFIFKDNFDPQPTKQLSQVAFDLVKDCESFMNANSKVYADYLVELGER